jgi:hypothetical protein
MQGQWGFQRIALQDHLKVVFGFFAFMANANPSRRRIASDREGLSFSRLAHLIYLSPQRGRNPPAVRGKKRCRMHGGATGSGAPPGNKNALKHGRYASEAFKERQQLRNLLRQARALIKTINEANEPWAQKAASGWTIA